jgi:peptide deformylase
MAVRPIIKLGNIVLRKKAQKVQKFDASLHTLLDDMLDTMLAGHGIGLAAPQVNVSQQVIVVRLPDDDAAIKEFGIDAGVLYEVVNPKIIRTSHDTVDGIEGCLSIPELLGTVCRYESVVVRAQDRNGNEIRIRAQGWLARVFQHEIDHLHGVLFIDLADSIWEIRTPAPDFQDKPVWRAV